MKRLLFGIGSIVLVAVVVVVLWTQTDLLKSNTNSEDIDEQGQLGTQEEGGDDVLIDDTPAEVVGDEELEDVAEPGEDEEDGVIDALDGESDEIAAVGNTEENEIKMKEVDDPEITVQVPNNMSCDQGKYRLWFPADCTNCELIKKIFVTFTQQTRRDDFETARRGKIVDCREEGMDSVCRENIKNSTSVHIQDSISSNMLGGSDIIKTWIDGCQQTRRNEIRFKNIRNISTAIKIAVIEYGGINSNGYCLNELSDITTRGESVLDLSNFLVKLPWDPLKQHINGIEGTQIACEGSYFIVVNPNFNNVLVGATLEGTTGGNIDLQKVIDTPGMIDFEDARCNSVGIPHANVNPNKETCPEGEQYYGYIREVY